MYFSVSFFIQHDTLQVIDSLLLAENPTHEELAKGVSLILQSEIQIPGFDILLCRLYIGSWNQKMESALTGDKIDSRLLATLIRDMNRIKYTLSKMTIHVHIDIIFDRSSNLCLRIHRKLKRLWISRKNGMMVFDSS